MPVETGIQKRLHWTPAAPDVLSSRGIPHILWVAFAGVTEQARRGDGASG